MFYSQIYNYVIGQNKNLPFNNLPYNNLSENNLFENQSYKEKTSISDLRPWTETFISFNIVQIFHQTLSIYIIKPIYGLSSKDDQLLNPQHTHKY